MTLAAIPSPSTAVWNLGPIPVRAYALCIIAGIVVACWITERRMRARGAPELLVLDVAIWAVPLGIVGARVYSLITTPQAYFGHGNSWTEPLKIWHGGLGIWGAVAGGALGVWIGARNKGVPVSFVADALAPGLPLAQAIGRWGNWFNNELYGRQTGMPWGLRVHAEMVSGKAALGPDGKPQLLPGLYHPTFLYEFLWDVGVAILVWQLDKRYRFGRGRAFAVYVMAYTAGRFWIESLRIDQANHFLGLRLNDWISILVFLGALIYFVRVRGPQTRLVTTEDGRLKAVPVDEVESTPALVPAQVGAASAEPESAGAAATGEPSGDGAPAQAGEAEAGEAGERRDAAVAGGTEPTGAEASAGKADHVEEAEPASVADSAEDAETASRADPAEDAETAGKADRAEDAEPAASGEPSGDDAVAEKAAPGEKTAPAGNAGPAEKTGPAGNAGPAGSAQPAEATRINAEPSQDEPAAQADRASAEK